ncbi:hypothetical protein B5G09_13170 [Alistipes sp. An54]|uniref:LutC/YkgG family protein n=1 Tax=Alistipes sp. An54 TaxID=1965645 RepID=UPI000B3ADB24|nr:LUD domain-containing protein [Alistipes sp. An54]OUN74635.1 hypothetical protein B5G09_13170 [Alistipes sp. An54]
MNSKEKILKSLAADGMAVRPRPTMDFVPQRFADREQTFVERLEAAGGMAVRMEPGETLDGLIARLYPEARRIASTLPEVTSATVDPDRVEDPRQLVDVDLGVVRGSFGVAENGAVWIAQDIRHKALYFGATSLMIVIPRDALVDTMQEAVVRPEVDDFGYGCFMSGPSKTADIEQALVFGAHGPMAVTVVLR